MIAAIASLSAAVYTINVMENEKHSRLMAVMFTDIVGYSKMMEQDETRTMEILEDHNRIIFPTVDGHGGKIIDAIGDGLLITFSSVYEACNCAMNIHKGIAEHNSNIVKEKQFYLRIGIHMGDIWEEEGRIFGNGVNIASRILDLAQPGGICISGEVYLQLANKTSVNVKDLGKKQLKNIQRPVQVYRLLTGIERPEAEPERRDEALSDYIKRSIEKGLSSVKDLDAGEKDWESGIERKFKQKIFGFVEGALDKALVAWDNMPEEKKENAVRMIKEKTWYEGDSFTHHTHIGHHKEEKDEPKELIGVGTAATLGFGGALIYFGSFWLIFPLTFIGFIPLGIGLGKLLSGRRGKVKRGTAYRREQERQLIEAAKQNNGRLTVIQVSSLTDLTMEESQKLLDEIAGRGYITQEVDDRGFIYYTFPEFLTGNGGDKSP